MLEPYFNINGFISGYVGPGSKTIIPSKAECRIDIRLVVDQRTHDIFEKVTRHVAKVDPRVQVLPRGFGHMEASRTPPDHPAVGAVGAAIAAWRKMEPVVNLCAGGSLPNAVWPDVLGVAHIGVPYANADENNHSPNENMSLERYYDGIHVSAQVFQSLADADTRGAVPRRAKGSAGVAGYNEVSSMLAPSLYVIVRGVSPAGSTNTTEHDALSPGRTITVERQASF